MPEKEQIAFLRTLSTEMEAGIQTLDVLDHMKSPVAQTAAKEIRAGESITCALATACPSIPPHLIECIRAGESCGKIAAQMASAADAIQADLDARRRLLGAIAYPCTVATLAIVVAVGLTLFVFPIIIGAMGNGAELPIAARGLLATVHTIESTWNLWLILLSIFVLVVTNPAGKTMLVNLLRKTPVIGPGMQKAEAARVCRALAQMLGAGVDVFQSLKLSEKIAQSPELKGALGQAEALIRQGATLTESLAYAGLPKRVLAALETGERTGKLDLTLSQTATVLEKEAEANRAFALGLLSNGALLGAGILVGWLAIATYGSMFSLYADISKG
jgi:type II secretory pathway component PulF